MKKSRLHKDIEKYLSQGISPLHMPGHKRTLAPDQGLPYEWDVTEVEGLDDLHAAGGILRKAMERTAALCGADRSFYLVNGSTAGNLAGVFAMVKRGDEIIMARNCHRSLFHIVQLLGLRVHWLLPPMVEGYAIPGAIRPQDVAKALSQHPASRAIILTSPTYEGVVSDIAAIAALAHEQGVPLLVDEAHGAHFGLFMESGFPDSAIHQGADLSVQSYHKTLPSLTQTAVIHLTSRLIDEIKLQQGLAIFETSSPSYPLLVSLDACTEYLLEKGAEAFRRWRKNLEAFDQEIASLQYVKVLCHGKETDADYGFFGYDSSKILINAKDAGLTGPALQDVLRNTYQLETEMTMGDNVLAMTGPVEESAALQHLTQALCHIDDKGKELAEANGNREVAPSTADGFSAQPLSVQESLLSTLPEPVLSIAEALEQEASPLSFSSAAGHICHEYVYCYPPGIPLLIPGERIRQETIHWLVEMEKRGSSLRYTESADNAGTISCIK